MASTEPTVKTFSVADYVVFVITLVISAGIGIFFAVKKGGQKSTKQFLMADKSMGFFPLSLSVLASFFSASTLLGTPAEIYQFGTMYWISVFGAVFAPLTGALLFGPMFYKLKVVSVFQDLAKRTSVSSMLNSLAAVTWEDFLKPSVCTDLSDVTATRVNKALAVTYGCVGLGLAFLVQRLGGTVLQGALVGGMFGLVCSLWLSVGAYVTKPINFKLPTTTIGCNTTVNFSTVISLAQTPEYANFSFPTTFDLEGVENLYGLSYLWFSAIGIVVCVLVGFVVSLITGGTKAHEVDPSLQLRLFHKIRTSSCRCCPGPHNKHTARTELQVSHLWTPAEHDTEPKLD
ncbi:sodium-coupled monocarboxylate transporter 1 [Aplysia californica]|uniref:Sodium-coupled monocarboxylate transporter 1 n=1 Tax=Aplysia californica TaxID=6500 RepID=A0ABM1A829_APLCA|nr:sodium-coupled monocarboxylate transporter 1 [Aplysia californica]